ncbi:hypothetical protein B0A55_11808 [Friedmanniomyces simplex]|uniref:C2H2-type domain-containing protein n=1 Tax=Friedmanniomyces simplex TaxID=329884 RepID=A0A4U0WPU8_9PEZI|nr:hypothetical protein B0A55_11808 [Friedmanniomyces simplex]
MLWIDHVNTLLSDYVGKSKTPPRTRKKMAIGMLQRNCDECDRAFDIDGELQQHLRDSPAHTVTFSCDECDRAFDTDGALQQHLRDSPVHTKPRTRSDIYKVWGGQPNLMHSYGLKPYNPGDFKEANAIVDVLTQQMGREKMEIEFLSRENGAMNDAQGSGQL